MIRLIKPQAEMRYRRHSAKPQKAHSETCGSEIKEEGADSTYLPDEIDELED